MKVLYFHQHFSTRKGSAATRSYEMAAHLVASGHQVTMVCGSYGGGKSGLDGEFIAGRRRGVVDGIDVIEFNLAYSNADGFLRRTIAFLRFAWRSVTVALREPCDLVFATTTPLTAAIPGLAARWLRGKPFVFEVRDLWPELPRAMGVIRNPLVLAAMSVLEFLAYRSAHRLIGLAPGIVEGIARLGVPASRIEMIPNGCDIALFSSAGQPWRPDRVAATDLMVTFAGTHGIANGLDAVLDAAGELLRRGRSDITFVLIGDGKEKPRLSARVQAEGLSNVLLEAPVSKERLTGLLAATDVGLQILANVPAFYFGTSPNKFFDYLAAGRPVLCNYPGWLATLIKDAGCGFAVPPDDPVAFADALAHAADHREQLPAMGAAAAGLARTQFDRNELAARFVRCLQSSIKQG